ncbi:MAG: hypothetical protein JKY41_13870 [Rhodobacteraceae bacterium]|nr:hypothetical protein [Paracoccaceae bacterium]
MNMDEHVTIAEQMAISMSHLLEDAELVQLGLMSPLAQVAALLSAHRRGDAGPAIEDPSAFTVTWAPRSAALTCSDIAAQQGSVRRFEADDWVAKIMGNLTGRMRQFIRAAQIDITGGINTLYLPTRDGTRRRIAGLAGLAELADIARPFLVYLPRQDERTFVQRVEFEVCNPLDSHDGTERQIILVSDLAMFRITEQGPEILSVHPSTDPNEFAARTPFAGDYQAAPQTPLPDPADLELLRKTVDPFNIRDIEFAVGEERSKLLDRLIEQESGFV